MQNGKGETSEASKYVIGNIQIGWAFNWKQYTQTQRDGNSAHEYLEYLEVSTGRLDGASCQTNMQRCGLLVTFRHGPDGL